MCTILLSPVDNPIAFNKYIISHPWISWELVADPLGFAEHILGTAILDCMQCSCVPPIVNGVTSSELFKSSLYLIFEALLAINRSLNFIRLRTSLKTISQ